MSESFSTPDAADVFQADEEPISVPVVIDHVIRTEEVPTAQVGFYTVAVPVSTAGGAQILREDARRRCATIVSLVSDLYLGNTQGDVVNNASAARWPAGTPLVITALEEVWASGVSSADTVTVIIENWSR